MRSRPLKNDTWRVYIDPKEYRILLETMQNQEQRNAFRLQVCSLRVGTVVRANFNRLKRVQTPHGELWFLSVSAKDSTDRDAELKPRDVWIPDDLVESLERTRGAEPGEDKRMIPKTKRAVQQWIEDAREKAATRTGNDEYLKVSCHDFRRYFATHYLYRMGLDKNSVQQLGGWKCEEHMFEYLLLPDDLLAESLADANLLGTAPDKNLPPTDDRRQRLAVGTIEDAVDAADRDEQRAIGRRLVEIFEDTAVKLSLSTRDPEETNSNTEDTTQLSFDRDIGGTHGRILPHVVAKGGYTVALVAFAAAMTL